MRMHNIQDRIAGLLGQDEWLAGRGYVPLCENNGDIQAKIVLSLQKQKRCLVVQTPGFAVTSSASKAMVGIASVTVRAVENVMESRKRRDDGTSQNAAEAVAWALNLAPVPGAGTLVVKSISSEVLDDKTLAYDVNLEVQTTLALP